jgi:hypothetical protein
VALAVLAPFLDLFSQILYETRHGIGHGHDAAAFGKPCEAARSVQAAAGATVTQPVVAADCMRLTANGGWAGVVGNLMLLL